MDYGIHLKVIDVRPIIFDVCSSADDSLLDDQFICIQAQHFRFSFPLPGWNLVTTAVTHPMLESFSSGTFFHASSNESTIKYLSIIPCFCCSWLFLPLCMSSPGLWLMLNSNTLSSLLSSMSMSVVQKIQSQELCRSYLLPNGGSLIMKSSTLVMPALLASLVIADLLGWSTVSVD